MNPYQTVLDAIWAALEARASIQELVLRGNRHKYDDGAPPKEGVATADLPELRVLPVAGTFSPRVTNKDTEVTKQYSVQVITGSRDVSQVLELEFEVFRAMLALDFDVLEWEGEPFVQNVRLTSATEGDVRVDLNRGISGWVSIMTVEVQMMFLTEELIKEQQT